MMPNEITMNGYQTLAARTIAPGMSQEDILNHALHGLSAEVGEIHSLFQKMYQGHSVDDEHFKKELGDLFWFAAEACTAKGWDMGDVAILNILKLKSRYPNGFEAERSLHREAGDI